MRQIQRQIRHRSSRPATSETEAPVSRRYVGSRRDLETLIERIDQLLD
jgi:hypothetical protein